MRSALAATMEVISGVNVTPQDGTYIILAIWSPCNEAIFDRLWKKSFWNISKPTRDVDWILSYPSSTSKNSQRYKYNLQKDTITRKSHQVMTNGKFQTHLDDFHKAVNLEVSMRREHADLAKKKSNSRRLSTFEISYLSTTQTIVYEGYG